MQHITPTIHLNLIPLRQGKIRIHLVLPTQYRKKVNETSLPPPFTPSPDTDQETNLEQTYTSLVELFAAKVLHCVCFARILYS